MTSVRVIGTSAACAGFALAGLPTIEVVDAHAGALALLTEAVRPEIGVVLIEESALDALPDADRRELARRPLPIIVPFPGPSWEAQPRAPEERVLELLQRAIGYRVRLR